MAGLFYYQAFLQQCASNAASTSRQNPNAPETTDAQTPSDAVSPAPIRQSEKYRHRQDIVSFDTNYLLAARAVSMLTLFFLRVTPKARS